MRFRFTLLITIIFVANSIAHAHPGRTDKKGGHFNRKTGIYHCNTSQCKRKHLSNDGGLQEAAREKRPFSLIYNRKEWGGWLDFDKNCRDTRTEALIQQADGPLHFSKSGCDVIGGTWIDPFSNTTFTNHSLMDLDHIIPLKWAHRHGASNWSRNKKRRFANDLENLILVDAGLNRSKQDKGPDQWMPPNHLFRCNYIYRWKLLIEKYPSLAMTSSESRVFSNQMSACKNPN